MKRRSLPDPGSYLLVDWRVAESTSVLPRQIAAEKVAINQWRSDPLRFGVFAGV
jgi:hypothetical protein